ncbi:hypothetical protein D3C87_1613030 [compost metagenome]
MAGGAGTRIAKVHVGAVLLHARDKVGQGGDAALLADREHHRHGGHQADRRQIAARVELALGIQRRCDRQRPHVAEGDGVAIGRGTGHALVADHGAAAAQVFHHDGLAQVLAHGLRHDAGQPVRGTAGGIRHHHGDGTRGIVLRVCVCVCAKRKQAGAQGRQEFLVHVLLLAVGAGNSRPSASSGRFLVLRV